MTKGMKDKHNIIEQYKKRSGYNPYEIGALERLHKSRSANERVNRLESLLGIANTYIDDVSDKGIKSKLKYMMNMYLGEERGTKEEYKQKLYEMIEKL